MDHLIGVSFLCHSMDWTFTSGLGGGQTFLGGLYFFQLRFQELCIPLYRKFPIFGVAETFFCVRLGGGHTFLSTHAQNKFHPQLSSKCTLPKQKNGEYMMLFTLITEYTIKSIRTLTIEWAIWVGATIIMYTGAIITFIDICCIWKYGLFFYLLTISKSTGKIACPLYIF